MKSTTNLKKYVFLFIIAISLSITTRALACDICGCFMGITPYDNQSSFGLIYRYRSFNGYYGHPQAFFPAGSQFFPARNNHNGMITDHNGNPNDYEVYRATELRARYFVSKRLEINAILPYNSNSEYYNGNLNTVAGIGDANIYVGYHLLRNVNQQVFKQRLIVGAGIKLPTGKDDAVNFEGERYSQLTQAGTGSTDGFVYFNYLLGYKSAGASLSATYKANGQNQYHEGIANSTTSYLNLFYNVGINKDLKVIPSAQLAYEYSGGEKYMGVKTGEHVMNNLMGGVGLDIFVKNITFNMAVQAKTWSASDDHPQPSGRVVLGITYNVNQLYYLINSKN
jgi:hypothetical protein